GFMNCYDVAAFPFANRYRFNGLPFSVFSPATTSDALVSAPAALVWVWSGPNNNFTFSSPNCSYRSAINLVTSINKTFCDFATSAAHSPYFPGPRSTRPFFQMLRTVNDRTIGVAPFALVSAIIFRMYQPKVWTNSCFLVSRLS